MSTPDKRPVTLQQINDRLSLFNKQYEKLLICYKSEHINKKSFSKIIQDIYIILQTGSTQSKVNSKNVFLSLFRSYIRNFINLHLLSPLEHACNNDEFQKILAQRWHNFKLFTFFYYAFSQCANNHYESAYFGSKTSGKSQQLNSQQGIFSIPVIAVHLFKLLILNRFQQKITHIILNEIKKFRKNKIIKSQSLRILFQIIWSCGMQQFVRIRTGYGVQFYLQNRVQFIKQMKQMKRYINCEDYIKEKILNNIIHQTSTFYKEQYQQKLCKLNSTDEIHTIKQMIEFQIQFSEYHLISESQRKQYMGIIYQKILLNSLESRLRKQGSLKSIIQNFKYDSQQCLKQIKTYFTALKGVINKSSVVKLLGNIISQVILQKGNQINKKINKRKDYIIEMICLKKSIDTIIEDAAHKHLKLLVVKDKAFKKILDSIQTSRNLAQYADFQIKQCIKLKLDQEACYEKFSDVFLLLNSITSTDSFLLYHQQMLAKRVIQILNQPKFQLETLILKKISQRIGLVSVTSHLAMIKDIQTSQQISEKYNNRLPFSSFKWTLKIFNSSHWPDNIAKQKYTFQIPNILFHQTKAIQQLYHEDNQYRYLNWKLQKGISLFQGKFGQKKVRFQAQNSYMIVLLLIAQQPNHSILYGNLTQLIKCNKTDAHNRHDALSLLLYVLIQSKLIIRKQINQKYSGFSASEQLSINLNYSSAQSLKPNQVTLIKASPQLSKQLHRSSIDNREIMKDRQKLIQAVLVKQLKHSHATKDNSVTFNQLYKVVKEHPFLGGFNFNQNVVKQRLQELIAREYCLRDQHDRKVYHYVA